MLNLSRLSLHEINGGINLIDLGAAGKLSSYWHPLRKFLNLYAFELNKEECERLAATATNLASATYIPSAIAGEKKSFSLYKTRSSECWSLLEPDMERLSRFSFHDLFKVDSVSQIEAMTLNDVESLKEVEIDVIKSDTQGLELPILKSVPDKVKNAFLIETETGLVENYKGETTFYQINAFMDENSFLLFDINTNHRISRDNHFSKKARKQEIMWCEAIWLKDYVAIERKEGLNIDRAKVLKVLILCANHGCIDYGFELATLFFNKKLITSNEYDALKDEKNWRFPEPGGMPHPHGRKRPDHKLYSVLERLFATLLPGKYRRELGYVLLEASKKPHPIKKLFNR